VSREFVATRIGDTQPAATTSTDAVVLLALVDGLVLRTTVPIKFATEQDALNYIADMGSDKRRGRWIDTADGRMPLREWAKRWIRALDVEPRTEENYQGLLRNSILPRWASVRSGRSVRWTLRSGVKSGPAQPAGC
jgi:hypothetical protein